MQWLITGCSSGLGLELARAALDAGHKVIASSRNPSNTPELVKEIESRGGKWIKLDIASEEIEKTIHDCISKFGPVDVLINNAGYAEGGVLEEYTPQVVQKQFQTNLFGLISTIQAVLPSMRENRGGAIVNVGSAALWQAFPWVSIYSASKYAVDGLSESLRLELEHLGIRVLSAIPGHMRTAFVDEKKQEAVNFVVPEPYKGSMSEHVMGGLIGVNGTQATDPARAAKAILKEVTEPTMVKQEDGSEKPLLRMPLGKESVEGMKARASNFLLEAKVFEERALACDF